MTLEYIHMDDVWDLVEIKRTELDNKQLAEITKERDKWRGIAAGLYIAGNMKWGWKDAAKAYEEGMNNE